jgi:hypothetical protein
VLPCAGDACWGDGAVQQCRKSQHRRQRTCEQAAAVQDKQGLRVQDTTARCCSRERHTTSTLLQLRADSSSSTAAAVAHSHAVGQPARCVRSQCVCCMSCAVLACCRSAPPCCSQLLCSCGECRGARALLQQQLASGGCRAAAARAQLPQLRACQPRPLQQCRAQAAATVCCWRALPTHALRRARRRATAATATTTGWCAAPRVRRAPSTSWTLRWRTRPTRGRCLSRASCLSTRSTR